MTPLTIKTCLRTLLQITIVISVACGQDRKITAELNPGCKTCTSKDILVYVKAEGPHDALHVFWDFQTHRFGTPAVAYIVTSLNATMQIIWRGVYPNVMYNEEPKYAFFSGISDLYEYNDVKDIGHFDPRMPHRIHKLEDVSWNITELYFNENEAMILARGEYNKSDTTGNIDIKLDLIPFTGYAKELPRLIHTANSTLVDVSLRNWSHSADYNSSRFAMRMLMSCSDSHDETMHLAVKKSLDDEHTPGVFEIIEILTPESFKSDDGAFIQFRPIAYTEPRRDVSSSTNIYVSDFANVTEPFRKNNLPLFGEVDYVYQYPNSLTLVQEVNISIGVPGDGFYKQSNFTSWSYTVGYGRPPVEGFSLFVVIIICVGLGVPVLLTLSGIVYVMIRRHKQRNAPARFIDEE